MSRFDFEGNTDDTLKKGGAESDQFVNMVLV